MISLLKEGDTECFPRLIACRKVEVALVDQRGKAEGDGPYRLANGPHCSIAASSLHVAALNRPSRACPAGLIKHPLTSIFHHALLYRSSCSGVFDAVRGCQPMGSS